MNRLLLFDVAVTVFISGLIWFVQVVHYPPLKRVDAGCFQALQKQRRRAAHRPASQRR